MRKHFLPISLLLLAINAYALPAPSALDARERRLNQPTPTPTPRQQIQIQPQIQTQPFAQPQTQTRSQTRAPTQIQTKAQPRAAAVSPNGARPSTTVVIDAGHGGHDRGGIAGQRVDEKTMNLDVSLRLRSVLQSYGYRVVMTRDTDVFIPLGTRVAIANSYRDAIFVCIHFNATSRRSASGIETYFYSSQSLPLASAIHYYVAGGAPSANRGVRRRGFYVLRNTRIPSVLVECGFLNQSDRSIIRAKCFLSSKARLRDCARSPKSCIRGTHSGRDKNCFQLCIYCVRARDRAAPTVPRPNALPRSGSFALETQTRLEELIKIDIIQAKEIFRRRFGFGHAEEEVD